MTVIDKIAKKANVSKCTVYRALKGQSKENWASTKSRSDKIRKIALNWVTVLTPQPVQSVKDRLNKSPV